MAIITIHGREFEYTPKRFGMYMKEGAWRTEYEDFEMNYFVSQVNELNTDDAIASLEAMVKEAEWQLKNQNTETWDGLPMPGRGARLEIAGIDEVGPYIQNTIKIAESMIKHIRADKKKSRRKK